jgi:hypothetical protein
MEMIREPPFRDIERRSDLAMRHLFELTLHLALQLNCLYKKLDHGNPKARTETDAIYAILSNIASDLETHLYLLSKAYGVFGHVQHSQEEGETQVSIGLFRLIVDISDKHRLMVDLLTTIRSMIARADFESDHSEDIFNSFQSRFKRYKAIIEMRFMDL